MTKKLIIGPATALLSLKRLSTSATGVALMVAAAGFATPSLARPTDCNGKGLVAGCPKPTPWGKGAIHGGGRSATPRTTTRTR
jgi:hypothetical protein